VLLDDVVMKVKKMTSRITGIVQRTRLSANFSTPRATIPSKRL
jgi:hypothetical protein